MRILYSKTGSDGNCTIIDNGKDLLMIDAGIKLEKLNKEIGYRLSEVKYCLITHIHLDHSKYLPKILDRGIQCYGHSKQDFGYCEDNFCFKKIFPLKQFSVGSYEAIAFDMTHINVSGSLCPTFSFLIYDKISKKRLYIATDTHYLNYNQPACEIYLIECNYIEKEDYTEEIKYINSKVESRRLISHLSLQGVLSWLKKQDLSKINEIYLIHVSKDKETDKEYIVDEIKNILPLNTKIYI